MGARLRSLFSICSAFSELKVSWASRGWEDGLNPGRLIIRSTSSYTRIVCLYLEKVIYFYRSYALRTFNIFLYRWQCSIENSLEPRFFISSLTNALWVRLARTCKGIEALVYSNEQEVVVALPNVFVILNAEVLNHTLG